MRCDYSSYNDIILECKDVLAQGSRGNIQSPNYPNLYPPNSNCLWMIEAPQHVNIRLVFESFDLEGKVNHACVDYIEIFDEFTNSVCFFILC